jgi:hypothetical protein
MFGAIKNPLKVALLGVNERDRVRLEMFFELHWSSNCLPVSESQADLCILELDSPDGKKLLQRQLENHPDRPLIVLSVHDTDIDGTTLLRKPLNVNLLKDTIEEFMRTLVQQPVAEEEKPAPQPRPQPIAKTDSALQPNDETNSALTIDKINERRRSLPDSATQARIIRGSCGLADNIELGNQSYGSGLYYDPGTHFQQVLKNAIEQCRREIRPLRLSMPGDKYIALLPQANIALTNLSDSKLRPRCLLPIREHQIRIDYPVESDLQRSDNSTAQDIDGLLWKVTLWSARGRLPLGTNIENAIGLRQWPNLTRLLATPQFLRIAALWVKTPLSLNKTAKFLNIEARYVCAFFSACYALELTQILSATDGQDVLQNEPGKSVAPKGLLRRILRHLRVA